MDVPADGAAPADPTACASAGSTEIRPPNVAAMGRRVDDLWTTTRQSTRRIDTDELALDPDVGIELRRVCLIRWLETDATLLPEEPLEGDRVLLHLGHDDVAVAGRLLRSDDDEVTVRDVCIDHRVAADPQDVCVAAGRQQLWHGHRLADFLVRLDRATGSDLADDRQRVRHPCCPPGAPARPRAPRAAPPSA